MRVRKCEKEVIGTACRVTYALLNAGILKVVCIVGRISIHKKCYSPMVPDISRPNAIDELVGQNEQQNILRRHEVDEADELEVRDIR